ncbi:MAG: hypothetical protein QNJ00_12795 [Woeseiaceae bacterium]|nr:hypothetical protein [Woeseiaceae bacterium]
MAAKERTLKQILVREAVLFLWLLFAGLVVLPIAVWFVGDAVFGSYPGSGFGAFFGMLNAKIRAGDAVAWFLVLSPYLVISALRLMALGWRLSRRPAA